MYISNITCDKDRVNEMKVHMLMLMNAWMMLVLMKCKCQMQCLTLGCYSLLRVCKRPMPPAPRGIGWGQGCTATTSHWLERKKR